jgi:hypothetical protein
VVEANAVYLATNGTDVAPCDRARPCIDFLFGLQQLNGQRTHLIFAPGSYTSVRNSVTQAPSPSVEIHGHGATMTAGNSDAASLRVTVPTKIRNLTLINADSTGYGLNLQAATELANVTVKAPNAIGAFAPLVASNIEAQATSTGLNTSSTVTIDRAVIHGGTHGITASSGTLDITNALIYNTTGSGVQITGANGQIKFSTIARTGLNTSESEVFGVECGGQVTLVSSIVYTFFSNPEVRPPTTSCMFAGGTIVGPKAQIGATNVDPSFVNESGFNFHINGNSPARDAVDTGPALDFEGDPRPRGARFDIGADEAP